MEINHYVEKVNITVKIESFYNVVYIQNLINGKEELKSISNTNSKMETSIFREPKVFD